jgi:hypothetical protein
MASRASAIVIGVPRQVLPKAPFAGVTLLRSPYEHHPVLGNKRSTETERSVEAAPRRSALIRPPLSTRSIGHLGPQILLSQISAEGKLDKIKTLGISIIAGETPMQKMYTKQCHAVDGSPTHAKSLIAAARIGNRPAA